MKLRRSSDDYCRSLGGRGRGLKPPLDNRELGVKVRNVWDEVLDYRLVRQG
jgi:hypothetical protein